MAKKISKKTVNKKYSMDLPAEALLAIMALAMLGLPLLIYVF